MPRLKLISRLKRTVDSSSRASRKDNHSKQWQYECISHFAFYTWHCIACSCSIVWWPWSDNSDNGNIDDASSLVRVKLVCSFVVYLLQSRINCGCSEFNSAWTLSDDMCQNLWIVNKYFVIYYVQPKQSKCFATGAAIFITNTKNHDILLIFDNAKITLFYKTSSLVYNLMIIIFQEFFILVKYQFCNNHMLMK